MGNTGQIMLPSVGERSLPIAGNTVFYLGLHLLPTATGSTEDVSYETRRTWTWGHRKKVLPPPSGQKIKSEPVGVHCTYPGFHSVIRTTYSVHSSTLQMGAQVPPKRCHLPNRTSLQTNSQQFGCDIARLTENTVTHTCYNSLMWYSCQKVVSACTLLNICHMLSSMYRG